MSAMPDKDFVAEFIARWETPGAGFRAPIGKRGFELPSLAGLEWHRIDAAGDNNWLVAQTSELDKYQFDVAPGCNGNILVLQPGTKCFGRLFIRGSQNVAIIIGSRFMPSPVNVNFHSSNHIFFFGKDCTSNTTTFEMGTSGTAIIVGEDCMFSAGIDVMTDDQHAIIDLDTGSQTNRAQDILIEPHVWVGMHSLILKGARIGFGAIVGARSVVSGYVEPQVEVAGSPATVRRENVSWIRERCAGEDASRKLSDLRCRLKQGNESAVTTGRDTKQDLALFASKWGLDISVLNNKDKLLRLAIERDARTEFKGTPDAISITELGRFGNRFYQLLNASMTARRLGCAEIRVSRSLGMGTLPTLMHGIRFIQARDAAQVGTALRGVFFTYRGLEPLLEPLDPLFIRDTIEKFVAPFFALEPVLLSSLTIALHFRAGDVFADTPGWVPHPYVMPPASFYIGAVEYARLHLGVNEVVIVYEDRGNPAIGVVEDFLRDHGIAYRSQSGSVDADAATLLGASHLVIPYGTFGEAAALLSKRLRTLFAFRSIESHEWLYKREQSLLEAVLRRANGVRTFVTKDTAGSYIAPLGRRRTPEQFDLIRTYPGDALALKEIT